MTDWSTAADDYRQSMADRPAAKAPSTFAEILAAGWTGGGLETIGGLSHYRASAVADLEAAVAGETGGKTLAQFTGLGNQEAQVAAVLNSLDQLPEEARKRIAPLTDIPGRAAEKAAADEAKVAAAAEGTYDLGGQAMSMLSFMARQVVDPVNLATMPVGGPLRGPVLKMLGREALIAMGIVGAQQPVIAGQRAELDLAAGNPVANVLAAGIGTAAFAGLFRAGGAAYRAVRAEPAPPVVATGGTATAAGPANVGRTLAPPPAATAPAVALDPRVSAEDFAAAAQLVERDQVVDAGAVPRTPAGRIATGERVDAAAAAMEAGRAQPRIDPPPTAPPQLPFDVAPPAAPVTTVPLKRIAALAGDVETVVLTGGRRMVTRPAVVELADVVTSHTLDGKVNPTYPAELQPRDRSAGASRSFVAERAKDLEPERLGRSVTPDTGAPIVGPDMIVESGNGRAMMIARAYDRVPEKAAEYRAYLAEQGYDVAGFEFPVLVRIRESDLPDMAARAAFAREANVSTVAGLSAREQAASDARGLTDDMLAMWAPGETASAANARFVRAFAERIVAAEERPQFVGAGDRLSAAGARRIEAAMVQRAWGADDVVSALYEETSPTSRAILGAMADTAPEAARLKVAIADGRVPADADPTPALLEAFRLVERARQTGQKVADMIDQVDIETGAVPADVADAARLYFREDNYRVAAGRDVVAGRINKAIFRALDRQNALADLFGVELTVGGNLRAAKLVGEALDEQPIDPSFVTPVAAAPAPLIVTRTLPDGTVLYGKPGQIHADLLTADAKQSISDDDFGFATGPGQRPMTREEAFRYVQENQPGIASRLDTPQPSRRGEPELIADRYNKLTAPEPAAKVAPEPAAAATGASATAAEAPTITGTSPASVMGPNGAPYTPPPGLAAQAEQALADAGGDLRVFVVDDAGNQVEVSARQYLKDADDYDAAAAELADCIANATREAAE